VQHIGQIKLNGKYYATRKRNIRKQSGKTQKEIKKEKKWQKKLNGNMVVKPTQGH